jgi:hypothetical protein
MIIVAASSTQVDVGWNAGRTHTGRTPDIYIHSTLAVLTVSDIRYIASAFLSKINLLNLFLKYVSKQL